MHAPLSVHVASVLSLLTALAVACEGSTTSETLGLHPDGGHGTDGATGDSGGRGQHDAGGTGSPEAGGECNLVMIVPPIVTVKDSTTGEPICDATLVADAGLLGLFSCGASQGCTGKCQYTVGGLDSSSAQSITVTAPDYGTATASVMDQYCGCGTTPCAGAQQVSVSLVHQEGIDAAPPPACPAAEPTKGAACTTQGLYCQYGTNPNTRCDDVWECESSTWQVITSSAACGSMSTTCPATFAAASANAACPMADVQQVCVYAQQGTCICTDDPGGLPVQGGPKWSCTPTTPGCPSTPPALGTDCPKDTPSDCDYGQCSGGASLTCVGGYWALANVGCPA